jgi:hypothetical protein
MTPLLQNCIDKTVVSLSFANCSAVRWDGNLTLHTHPVLLSIVTRSDSSSRMGRSIFWLQSTTWELSTYFDPLNWPSFTSKEGRYSQSYHLVFTVAMNAWLTQLAAKSAAELYTTNVLETTLPKWYKLQKHNYIFPVTPSVLCRTVCLMQRDVTALIKAGRSPVPIPV